MKQVDESTALILSDVTQVDLNQSNQLNTSLESNNGSNGQCISYFNMGAPEYSGHDLYYEVIGPSSQDTHNVSIYGCLHRTIVIAQY